MAVVRVHSILILVPGGGGIIDCGGGPGGGGIIDGSGGCGPPPHSFVRRRNLKLHRSDPRE
ncbi:hypothetical protein P3S67_007161 [Capsicum chacoense]